MRFTSRRSSHKYDSIVKKLPDPIPKTIMNRKMFGILGINKRLMTHREGHLLLFYKSRDAKHWLFQNKLEGTCSIIRIKIDITQI